MKKKEKHLLQLIVELRSFLLLGERLLQQRPHDAHLPPSALIALPALFVLRLLLPAGNVSCSGSE